MKGLVFGICKSGHEKKDFKNVDKAVAEFLDLRPILHDWWDALTNPMSGLPPSYFVSPICQALGRNCGETVENVVDVGSDVVLGIAGVVSSIQNSNYSGSTPTPYMLSPTPSKPVSTWTPLSTPTAITPKPPTVTMTPTITVTPSATSIAATWTLTSTITPTFTPAYRSP